MNTDGPFALNNPREKAKLVHTAGKIRNALVGFFLSIVSPGDRCACHVEFRDAPS